MLGNLLGLLLAIQLLVELQSCMLTKAVRWCPCMQKKRGGGQAKGYTAAEHAAVMALLLADVQQKLEENPAAFPLGFAIISLDNASQHKAWLQSQPAARLNVIPAKSPDIHKVVEHPLHGFNKRFYKRFSQDLSCKTCKDAMALASEVLHQHTAESIWKDLQTLPATLHSIVVNKGDWADEDLC